MGVVGGPLPGRRRVIPPVDMPLTAWRWTVRMSLLSAVALSAPALVRELNATRSRRWQERSPKSGGRINAALRVIQLAR